MAALSQHHYPATVEAAANVIRSQCHVADAAPREAYVTAGAIPALLAVLRRHRTHVFFEKKGVQVAACSALQFIDVRDEHNTCGDKVFALFLCHGVYGVINR